MKSEIDFHNGILACNSLSGYCQVSSRSHCESLQLPHKTSHSTCVPVYKASRTHHKKKKKKQDNHHLVIKCLQSQAEIIYLRHN